MRESVERAVERTILSIKEWSTENGKDWTSFFSEVSTPRLIHMIRSGKISPWILYNSNGGINALDSLNNEQMMMIEDYVSPVAWKKRFDSSQDDVKFVLELTKKANL